MYPMDYRHGTNPPTAYARQILARGSLDPEEKKPMTDFEDNRTVQGLPELPAGYKVTEWLRISTHTLMMPYR